MKSGEEKVKWWQFGLRFLLLLTFGSATFCAGWKANEMHCARQPQYFLPDDIQFFKNAEQSVQKGLEHIRNQGDQRDG
jgi:hypothetical protein